MIRRTCLLLFFYIYAVSIHAQAPPLSIEDQKAIIQEVSKLLNEFYVFPETASKMQQLIESRLKEGAYAKRNTAADFATAIYNDLFSVSKDKHMSFQYDPELARGIRQLQSQNEEQSGTEQEQQLAVARRDNFGFRKVERLPGNVGYLDFRFFAQASLAGETAVAALNFLANCDAVIVDLRQNGGGDPTQIQLISSYFFKSPTHLNDIYTRSENLMEHYWTLPYVPGKKLDKADVYILTSGHTFSGAEEFSYSMKNLKRATLIGETTGGGAHPTTQKLVHEDFVLGVPYARAISPITKTNWEGSGVTPDISVPADQAFDRAYALAIEKLSEKATDEARKNELLWVYTGIQAKLHPVELSEKVLRSYVGVFQDRKITYENGNLYYQRTGPKYRLEPLTGTIFAVEGLDYFRLEFVLKEGNPVELVGLYDNGTREPSKRTG